MNFAIFRILGILLFLYLTWRNLREDYKENDLISYSWIALLAFFAGGRIIYGLEHWGIWNESWTDWLLVWDKPGMNYVGGYVAMIIASYLVSRKNGWKIWSFVEDSLNNFMIFFLFLMLDEFLRTRFGLMPGIYSFIIIIGLALSIWIKKKYRSFMWYRSGKKGFAFLFVNIILSLILMGVNFWFKNSLIYSFLYLASGLISLIGLFILGEVFEPLMVNQKKKKI
jgi:hypothetical protein